MNLRWSKRGTQMVKDAAQKAPMTDDSMRPGNDDSEHITMRRWLSPQLDELLTDIKQEIAEMFEAGTMRPFVEGEHIGRIPKRVKKRSIGDQALRKEQARRKEEQRADMLALRKRNNATMRSLLK